MLQWKPRIYNTSVSIEHITGSKIVQEPDSSGIWIILAKVNKYDSKAQLVNVRLPSKLTKMDYSEDYVKQLCNDVKELIPRNALECTRTSGSNGETTYTNTNILKLLKSNSEAQLLALLLFSVRQPKLQNISE